MTGFLKQRWFLSLLLFFLTVSAQAKELTALEVAQKIQNYYEQTADFQAAFVQNYTSETFDKTTNAKGFVYIKKPGKMRWDYKEPRPKFFLADETALYMVDPELEQVTVDRSFSANNLTAAVAFLWGKGNLVQEFHIRFLDSKNQPKDLYGLELTPKQKASFRKLEFSVDRKTFQVRQTKVEDPGGNINQITFSNISTNLGMKDDVFSFQIPKGFEVIELPKY